MTKLAAEAVGNKAARAARAAARAVGKRAVASAVASAKARTVARVAVKGLCGRGTPAPKIAATCTRVSKWWSRSRSGRGGCGGGRYGRQDKAVRVTAGGAGAAGAGAKRTRQKRPHPGAAAKGAAARDMSDSSDESDSSEVGAAVGRAIAKQRGAVDAGKAVAKRPCMKRARDSSDEGMDSSDVARSPLDSSDDEG